MVKKGILGQPPKTKTDANLIYLLDRVDALAAMESTSNQLISRDKICEKNKVAALLHDIGKLRIPDT